MQFLILFAVMALFAAIAPKAFKAFYFILIAPIFTVGPASFMYLGAGIMGWNVPFKIMCIVSFFTCAVPFLWWTWPREVD